MDTSFDKIDEGVQAGRELQNCARPLGTQPLISRHSILAPTVGAACCCILYLRRLVGAALNAW